jgi:glutathione peroxidase
MTGVFDFGATGLDGAPVELGQYRGRVLLIVNTASECGFTPQYRELEALQRRFGARGLVVLGFPCNQFGAQEPGGADAIGAFCRERFDVTFPLFAKIDVNGARADPLFAHLKRQAPGLLGTRAIKWNFTKFLIGKDGNVHRRYAPFTTPQALIPAIEKLLTE